MNGQTPQTQTVNDRLAALFQSLMEDDSLPIPAAFKPVAQKLVMNYLKNADPEQVKQLIIDLRDRLLPWVLGESE